MCDIYSLYMHVFPNGKLYIGITKDVKRRWQSRGYYYKKQPKIWRAICKYGWDNVQHIVAKTGLTREEAESAERTLISALGTVENGYNTAIGGDSLNGSYLSPYLHKMVYAGKKYGFRLAKIIHGERMNPANAAYWNQAAQDVTKKHGVFSPTNEAGIAEFWYHVMQWYDLDERIKRGEDCTEWRENTFERATYDLIMKGAYNVRA